ncbi:MAG TPA: helix-turn-helix domain-containing protein [Rhodanobacteraceae bacterium]|nr:helix-turn-helix domain-containing protein [Rhodanobacteraceae bacterium]
MADTAPARSRSGRRQRKRERMASHLAATAFELFEEQGYDAVTMEQIAAEADVAKATLYSYFPMKEALVAHRLRDEIAEGMAARAGALAARRGFGSRMRYLLRESAAWHASRRAYLPHYLRYLNIIATFVPAEADDKAPAGGARITLEAMAEMFLQGQQAGEVTAAVPAERLAWSLQYLLFGSVAWWLAHPDTDLEEGFLQAFDVLLKGAAAGRAGNRTKR